MEKILSAKAFYYSYTLPLSKKNDDKRFQGTEIYMHHFRAIQLMLYLRDSIPLLVWYKE
jgi:hypothetical protein